MIAGNIRCWRFWQFDEGIYLLYEPNGDSAIGEELKPKHALLTSIWQFPAERGNPHPAMFSLVLPIRCIYFIMDENKNGIVIDPYCGSGTTLVAAKILGYDFIGIDISQDYCTFASTRINNYKNEEKFALEEIAKHFVFKTFKERKQNGEFTEKYGKKANKLDPQPTFELFEAK